MMCKSSVSVNHLHLQVECFYKCTYLVTVYIFLFTLTRGQCKYLSNTLTQPSVNVLGHVSVDTKIICKVTLSLGLLSPPKPFFSSKEILSGNEMLKISI
jgi:hypothetical protein